MATLSRKITIPKDANASSSAFPSNAGQILSYADEISGRLDHYLSITGPLPTILRNIQITVPGVAKTVKQADISANASSTSSKDKETIATILASCKTDMDDLRIIINKVTPQHSIKILGTAQQAIFRQLNTKPLEKTRARLEEHVAALSRYAATDSLMTPMALLLSWEDEGTHWSGTKERYNVDYKSLDPAFQSQLDKALYLAQGGFGIVYKVHYRGVLLARKTIYITDVQRDKVEEEASIGQKLDRHHHIIKLVGTYWGAQGDNINILTFPVAICDLGQFLDSCEKWDMPDKVPLSEKETKEIITRLEDLGFEATEKVRPQVAPRLREIMGCITKALMWMHENDISHRDLKPANILLRRGEVFITDFGISRDSGKFGKSTTEFHAGQTPAYAAPELRNGEEFINPRQADIYALGCVLLYILTVIHAKEPAPFKDRERHSKRRDDFCAYLAFTPRDLDLDEEIVRFSKPHPHIPMELVIFLEPMFRERNRRPRIEQIDFRLQNLGAPDGMYHGPCCPYNLQLQRWSQSTASLELPAMEEIAAEKDPTVSHIRNIAIAL